MVCKLQIFLINFLIHFNLTDEINRQAAMAQNHSAQVAKVVLVEVDKELSAELLLRLHVGQAQE